MGSFAVRCCDVSFRVHCQAADTYAVIAHLPFESTPVSLNEEQYQFSLEPHDNSELFTVKRGLSVVSSSQRRDSALIALQKEIRIYVAKHATNFVFVHAGVVVWNDVAVIVPGFSWAGKSTLVHYLAGAGAVYYSDEYAVCDRLGHVHPFAVPISLRVDGGGRSVVMPDRVGSTPALPRLVVFARYEPCATWRPIALTGGQCMLRLSEHCISIRRNPAFVMSVIKAISEQAHAFLGARGDSEHVAQWINSII